MILTVDIGNTQTKVGVFEGEDLVVSERISTNAEKTETEYAIQLSYILEAAGVNARDMQGAVLSSVVPPVNHYFSQAIKKVTGRVPIIVGPGVKTGMKILIDDPATLGADMVVAAVGARCEHSGPMIVIDMGTATTYSYLDEKGDFRGAVIMPGVNASMESLVANAALLPKIGFIAPNKVIGTDTISSMQSGMIFGEAARIDGMVEKIREEAGCDAPVIATGGLAKVILPHCRTEIDYDDQLVLKGLKEIYRMNR